ncbi:hypothetical protein M2341_000567 [Sphingobium sp. B7D2B]|uniref:hypothetical protein n=1 Tax=Sphingobium sp. B7D2B TaxID=2940583 RepID=UPI002225ACCC|nr:hypothetical protein [Sphingobium sp. B7D2B]MCW2365120.1 hypothetical protein [Sphingobium sp. B7D2B]
MAVEKGALVSHKNLAALIPAFALTLSAALAAEEKQAMPADPAQQMPEQIIAEAETVHPAALYILATKLMAEGRMDDAVRWFYIGQLRYRFLLAAEPERLAENQPLFSALSESVGRPINEYAFGDVDAAVAHIDSALAWDAAHANGVTSKERHAEELAQVRAGLQKLRDDMIANKDQIRETRTRNGLDNR